MRRFIAVITVLATVAVAACQAEPAMCPQKIAEDVFTTTSIHAYNATIATGSGTNYICSGGGSATVMGTVTGGSGNQTEDVTITFHSCHDNNLGLDDLTYDGTFHYHGTFVGGYCTNCVGDAAALKLNGNVFLCDADMIDATCKIDFTLTNSSQAAFFDNSSGSVCGLTFP